MKLPEPFTPVAPDKPQTPLAPVYEDEQALKLAFAASLLKTPLDPFKAALAVIDTRVNAAPALWAANYWPNDPIVKAEIERLREEQGELAFLPSKVDLARSVWERAHSERTNNEDFTKMTRLYAEIMGFVDKGSRIAVDAKNSNGATVKVIASDLDEKL